VARPRAVGHHASAGILGAMLRWLADLHRKLRAVRRRSTCA
jgi:hypothetical protein